MAKKKKKKPIRHILKLAVMIDALSAVVVLGRFLWQIKDDVIIHKKG